jgi:hypothetical protein
MTDVSGSMRCPISGKDKYGSARNCYEIGILLALLIK